MSFITDLLKPARYVGGEYGVPEVKENAKVNFCMCFPDVYEVGMSNMGTRILYYMLNDMNDVFCERCYAPWLDYKEQLQKENKALCSIETKKPLKGFDFIGFSFQYELSYSNMLYMLDLGHIPFKSCDRNNDYPLVIGGGPCAVNPEPIYNFVDLFILGEAETALTKVIELYKESKDKIDRQAFLKEASNIDGVYVPALMTVEYDEAKLVKINGKKIVRQKEKNLDKSYFVAKAIVPNIEIVHDRAVVELYRGCANGCRFCQAGFIYRPVRERSVENLTNLCKDLVDFTGYDELSLNSLSTGDYSGLRQLLTNLKPLVKTQNLQLALPSLRLDSFDKDILQSDRKSSLTFAPEAGTQRLRDVINKNVTEENIFSSLSQAFSEGYSTIKLYFMLGLPTETQADIEGIADLAIRIRQLYYQKRSSKKEIKINVSVATFIPKPFTPFQWEAFDTFENIKQKQDYLKLKLKSKGISFSYHDLQSSLVEAAFARGDRRLSDVLLKAYQNGAFFDGWNDLFNYEAYSEAAKSCNINFYDYVGAKNLTDVLAWDFVDNGVTKEYLLNEREKAYQNLSTPSCNIQCNMCGLQGEGLCK